MSLRQQVERILKPAIDPRAPYAIRLIDALVNLLQEQHVGIIADTMAEVVERTKNTMEGAATHLRTATNVQLVLTDPSIVQVNVDGVMLVLIDNCQNAVSTPFRDGSAEPEPVLVDNRKVP